MGTFASQNIIRIVFNVMYLDKTKLELNSSLFRHRYTNPSTKIFKWMCMRDIKCE